MSATSCLKSLLTELQARASPQSLGQQVVEEADQGLPAQLLHQGGLQGEGQGEVALQGGRRGWGSKGNWA